jgi:photosystem II stability/assembly factor-like uncharacterized protein
MKRHAIIMLAPIFLSWAFSAAGATRSLAASSWQIRTIPTGSGVRIETVSPASFYVIGDFEGSHEWVSQDGGSTSTIHNPGPPFAPDSVVSWSASLNRQGAVTMDGRLWLGTRDGRDWTARSLPDTLGIPSAVFCRPGSVVWVGTREGFLLRLDPASDPTTAWSKAAVLGETPVRRILPSDDDRLCVLLDDGSLFAEAPGETGDLAGSRRNGSISSWIAAPFRAAHIDITRTGDGFAIERGSLVLWKTTDAGVTWQYANDTLARPQLAGWALQARRLDLRSDGLGVLACGDVLLATSDGGGTWRIAASGVAMFLDAAFDGLGDLLTVGERIHRSTDHANSIAQIAGGDFSHVVMGSVSTEWALDKGLLLSVNQGERWLRQPLPDLAGRLTHIAARGDYEVWLHFDGDGGPRTFYSDDRGATYAEIDAPGLLGGLRHWAFPAPGIGWACADSTILRSTNDGVEWLIEQTAPETITAMAARDSFAAAFSSRGRFLLTRDGGETWAEWESPRAAAVRSLAFQGTENLVAAGSGIALLATSPTWGVLAEADSGDTLRSVVMMTEESGWASGDRGILIGTTNGGASWDPYRVNLELNAFRGTLSSLSTADRDHAATGSGTSLIRFLPDGTGPIFRYGIAANSYLPRYLDIHVTARERLRGDSLEVTVDGVPVPTVLFDPEGFLYRAHYHVPSEPGERTMVTRGRDWSGNERVDTRFLGAVALDGAGRGQVSWDGESLALSGTGMDVVGMIELADEVSPFAEHEGWSAAGRPFQTASGGDVAIAPISPAFTLALWTVAGGGDARNLVSREGGKRSANRLPGEPESPVGEWQVLSSSAAPVFASGSILLILRDRTAPLAAGENLLRVFPLPARDDCTIDWSGPLASPFRWEVFDVHGRLLARGEAPTPATRLLRWQTRDAGGRLLPTGIYWIRVAEGSAYAVRRLPIVR